MQVSGESPVGAGACDLQQSLALQHPHQQSIIIGPTEFGQQSRTKPPYQVLPKLDPVLTHILKVECIELQPQQTTVSLSSFVRSEFDQLQGNF